METYFEQIATQIEDAVDRCVANFILDGKVVHLKTLEETIKN